MTLVSKLHTATTIAVVFAGVGGAAMATVLMLATSIAVLVINRVFGFQQLLRIMPD